MPVLGQLVEAQRYSLSPLDPVQTSSFPPTVHSFYVK